MNRRIGLLATALLMALATGCHDKPTPTPAASTSADAVSATARTPAAPTSLMAPAPGSSADAKGKMAHCPTTVDGAVTAINNVDGGVELLVTAKDPAAVADIRDRAKHLADASKDTSSPIKHNGSGAGGGQFGRCPVVAHDTVIDSADVEGGSKITVKPRDAAEIDSVRRESRERQAVLSEPGGKDAGQGKMAHCPSAVFGATTVVKELKDSVLVTVTINDDALVKDIRERTQHLVDAARKDPKSVTHDGVGDGGGALGRCPVVLKDTSLTAKDVPGGSELTVKPDKIADLPTLVKETKERTETFAPKKH